MDVLRGSSGGRSGWRQRQYFARLELPQDASAAEIQRAFRRLAQRHHPDAAAGAASRRFAEIVQAHEELQNPELREFLHTRTALSLRLGRARYVADPVPADALPRAVVTLRSGGADLCAACEGWRAAPGTPFVRCGRCAGSGELRMRRGTRSQGRSSRTICPRCQGIGRMPLRPCASCEGTGSARTQAAAASGGALAVDDDDLLDTTARRPAAAPRRFLPARFRPSRFDALPPLPPAPPPRDHHGASPANPSPLAREVEALLVRSHEITRLQALLHVEWAEVQTRLRAVGQLVALQEEPPWQASGTASQNGDEASPEPPALTAVPAPVESLPEARARGGFALRELRKLAAAQPPGSSADVELWNAYLSALEAVADLDGRIPPEYDAIVSEVFAPLLRDLSRSARPA